MPNHEPTVAIQTLWDTTTLGTSHAAISELPGRSHERFQSLPPCTNRINYQGAHIVPKPTVIEPLDSEAPSQEPKLRDDSKFNANDICPVCWVLRSITLNPFWDSARWNQPITIRDAPSPTSLDEMVFNDSVFLKGLEKVIWERRVYGSEIGRGRYSFQDYPYLPVGGCMVELDPWAGSIISDNDDGKPSLARLQNTSSDIDTLKHWIDECCSKHDGVCCIKDTDSHDCQGITGMRLINVHSRCITRATSEESYAALSYVWGSANYPGVTNPQFVNYPAPRTIEDSIELCKSLEIPYLWVDQYCISQTDNEEKHFQISQMHKIYQRARVTIIAAAGRDVHHGLPGIWSTPRQAQPHFEAGGRLFAAVLPHPINVIERSIWYSRGWTYQEALLSARRLVFTDGQAYFECNHPTDAEGIEEPIRSFAGVGTLGPRTYNSSLTLRRDKRNSFDIWNHVSSICQRTLTYETDIVDAVAGIFGDFVATGHLYGHLCGIPMYQRPPKDIPAPTENAPEVLPLDLEQSTYLEVRAGLLSGLLWMAGSPTTRRALFPSWSWAGWHGVDYRSSNQTYLTCEMSPTEVVFKTQDGRTYTDRRIATKLPRNIRFLEFEILVVQCRFMVSVNSLLPYVSVGKQVEHVGGELLMTLDTSTVPGMDEGLKKDWWDGLVFEQRRGDTVVMVVRRCGSYYERVGLFILDKRIHVPHPCIERPGILPHDLFRRARRKTITLG